MTENADFPPDRAGRTRCPRFDALRTITAIRSIQVAIFDAVPHMQAATRSVSDFRRAASSTRPRSSFRYRVRDGLVEEDLAVGLQQFGELRPEQLRNSGPNPRPGIDRIDPDPVDAQISGLLQQSVDCRLAVGKKRQQGTEHYAGLEARIPGRLDHRQPLPDAGSPRFPQLPQPLIERSQRDAYLAGCPANTSRSLSTKALLVSTCT